MTKGPNSDIQAVILCGPGHGLDPLVDEDVSIKCLLPIANKPMLYYPVTWLQQSGISDIILVVNEAHHSRITQFIKTHINDGANRITIYATENYEHGTVGVLKAVRQFLHSDFILLSCDLLTEFPLFRMIDQHRTSDAMLTVLLTRNEVNKQDEARYGDSEDAEVFTCFDETKKKLLYIENKADVDSSIDFKMALIAQHPCMLLRTNLTDAHCYIFRKSFLALMDSGSVFGKRNLYSVREELIPRIVKHQKFKSDAQKADPSCYTCAARLLESEFCIRVNNLKNYNEANKFALKSVPLGPGRISPSAEIQPKSQVGSDVQVGDFVKVGEKSAIKKSTLGNNVSIGKNVKLSNCILMDGVVIEDNCKIDNCLIGPFVRVKEKSTLKDCDIGPRYVIAPEANFKGETLSFNHDGI